MRRTYLACGVATVAIGVLVFRGGIGLAPAPRDILGDALWATMMVWWISAIVPSRSLGTRAGIALSACWLVEFSQLVHTGWLDALRWTSVGHLALGSGFDRRDLASYAGGVLLAAIVERVWLRRAGARQGGDG